MIQPILLILALMQLKFTLNSIKGCFTAEAVGATWEQIGVMFIELVFIAYLVITWNVIITIDL